MYIICKHQINFYDSHHKIRYRTPETPPKNMNYFVALQVTYKAIALVEEKLSQVFQVDVRNKHL